MLSFQCLLSATASYYFYQFTFNEKITPMSYVTLGNLLSLSDFSESHHLHLEISISWYLPQMVVIRFRYNNVCKGLSTVPGAQ